MAIAVPAEIGVEYADLDLREDHDKVEGCAVLKGTHLKNVFESSLSNAGDATTAAMEEHMDLALFREAVIGDPDIAVIVEIFRTANEGLRELGLREFPEDTCGEVVLFVSNVQKCDSFSISLKICE